MDAPVLALIDTSLRQGWVGVSRGESIVAARLLDPKRGHARDLSHSIDETLKEASASLADVTAIAVNVGPGSFTGIRVALATAKAVSYATGMKLVAIDIFDLVARDFTELTEDFRVVVDFQLNGSLVCDFMGRRRGDIRIVPATEGDQFASGVPLCGPGVEKVMRRHPGAKSLHGREWAPSREAFLAIALERVRAGAFADPMVIEPIYATLSSAEQVWLNRRTTASE